MVTSKVLVKTYMSRQAGTCMSSQVPEVMETFLEVSMEFYSTNENYPFEHYISRSRTIDRQQSKETRLLEHTITTFLRLRTPEAI